MFTSREVPGLIEEPTLDTGMILKLKRLDFPANAFGSLAHVVAPHCDVTLLRLVAGTGRTRVGNQTDRCASRELR